MKNVYMIAVLTLTFSFSAKGADIGRTIADVGYSAERVLYGVDTWRRTTNQRIDIVMGRENERRRVDSDERRDAGREETERRRIEADLEQRRLDTAARVYETAAETRTSGTARASNGTVNANVHDTTRTQASQLDEAPPRRLPSTSMGNRNNAGPQVQ